METIGYTASQHIRKPIAEVFHAVEDHDILCSYFTKTASAPMTEGAKVSWGWGGGETEEFFVTHVTPNKKIAGHWKAWKVDYHVDTVFIFTAKEDGRTQVAITESGFHNDETGRESAFGQCSGWTHMLMCLKAQLEHNIDLR